MMVNVNVNAPVKDGIRKNLGASLIALKKPTLNEQVDSKKLFIILKWCHEKLSSIFNLLLRIIV